MNRMIWIACLSALPLGACMQPDTANNAQSVAYLIDGQAQLAESREQAESACYAINRIPRLSNVTQFQHLLVVYDCRPPGDVGPDIKLTPVTAQP
jgi:hypothetical protein